MEDLMAEPVGHSADEFDESDGFDEAEDSLEADEFEDEDSLEDMDEFETDESDEGEDELEQAVADALEAEDADEFFGGFRKVLRTVGNVARRVAPIAKLIPIPQAQLIGRAADLIGNVLADEGDEFDALDAVSDYAEDEDGFDALAPVVAGLAIRGALKGKAAALPRAHRRQVVKAVSTATKLIARKHGAHAAVAAPAIVSVARRIATRRGLPAKHLHRVIKRVARIAARSPRALRRLVAAGTQLRAAAPSALRRRGVRGRRYGYRGGYASGGSHVPGGAGKSSIATRARAGIGARGLRYSGGGVAEEGGATGAVCPHCRRRTLRLRGPVTISIYSH
jgi:hypothetical protein